MITSHREIGDMLDMFEVSKDLYTMHRSVKKDGELRYDITEMPHVLINNHFNKTKGHVHSSGHKEIYVVLEGNALFLMQKGDKDITDVYAVLAKKGQSVIIPADYHHITVNVGRQDLKVGNWVSNNCKSDYGVTQRMKGMCYYVKSLGGNTSFVKNEKYQTVPEIRYELPLKEIPTDLNFLL